MNNSNSHMAQLANATPKQLQNSFLQRFFPSQNNNMAQTMPSGIN
jgi:hypothetical protein